MPYFIKISYSDGDSFKNWEDERNIDLEWKNIEVAKENLKRIKQHYKEYEFFDGWESWKVKETDIKKREDELKSFSWFSKGDWKHSIILKTDEGDDFQTSTFWCGYFESLLSAEIVDEDGDNDYKFTTKK